MITMSTIYFFFVIFATSFTAAFVSYWIGLDKGEKSIVMKNFATQEESIARVQRLSAEKQYLQTKVNDLEFELRTFYPENSWNNVPNVPEQSQ